MHRRGYQRDSAHHYREAASGTIQLIPPLPPAGSAILLDVDGTLLEFANDPSRVVADVELIELLLALRAARSNAVALISGRSLAELDRVFAPHRFAAAGAHGSEFRDAHGRINTARGRPLDAEVFERLRFFVRRVSGLLLEAKPAGVALHYRGAPAQAAACNELMRDLAAELDDSHRLLTGKMVCELTPRSHDKGTAVRELLASPEFRRRSPVFVGDDDSDEAAFRVVNSFGGMSIRVGGCRASEASFELPGVSAVRAWLRSSLARAA